MSYFERFFKTTSWCVLERIYGIFRCGVVFNGKFLMICALLLHYHSMCHRNGITIDKYASHIDVSWFQLCHGIGSEQTESIEPIKHFRIVQNVTSPMKGAKLYTFGIFGALDISAVEADILTTMSGEQSKAQNWWRGFWIRFCVSDFRNFFIKAWIIEEGYEPTSMQFSTDVLFRLKKYHSIEQFPP